MLVGVVAVLPQAELVVVVVGHVRLEQDPVGPGRQPLTIVVWSSNPRVILCWNNPNLSDILDLGQNYQYLPIEMKFCERWSEILVFVGWWESRHVLLQLSKSLPILSCQTQLVASQKLTQLVLFHQPYHLESQTSKKIQCQNMIWKPVCNAIPTYQHINMLWCIQNNTAFCQSPEILNFIICTPRVVVDYFVCLYSFIRKNK